MATYLDEGMDIVSAMPGEVQRAMALIRDLDGVSVACADTRAIVAPALLRAEAHTKNEMRGCHLLPWMMPRCGLQGSTKLLDALKRKQTDYIKRVQDAVKDKVRPRTAVWGRCNAPACSEATPGRGAWAGGSHASGCHERCIACACASFRAAPDPGNGPASALHGQGSPGGDRGDGERATSGPELVPGPVARAQQGGPRAAA